MNKFLYELTMPGIVEIQSGTKTLRLNMKSAGDAIETVKRTRDTYYTEKAYQHQLSKYEGALSFLQANA